MAYTNTEIFNLVLQGQNQDCIVKEHISTLSFVSSNKIHITSYN